MLLNARKDSSGERQGAVSKKVDNRDRGEEASKDRMGRQMMPAGKELWS